MEKLLGIAPISSRYLMTSNTALLFQTNLKFTWLLQTQSEIVNTEQHEVRKAELDKIESNVIAS